MAGELVDLQRGCTRAREWVSLRVDGELSEIERLLLRRHLSRCESCRTFAESVRGATEIVRATPHEVPSRPLAPAEPAAPVRRLRYRLVAVAAALVVGAGIGSAVVLSDGSGPGEPKTGIDVAVNPPVAPTPPPGGTTVAPPGENV
jgi:predicted anti-sigma-YlaC factor YlaD